MPAESAWPLLCRVIERLDWIDDERFADIRGRFAHMPEIVAGIDEALAHRTRDEWGEIFDAEGIIWGPVLGLHEVADDPQAEALGLFPTLDSPDIGPYRSVGIPMRFANADVGPRGPSPRLGEGTRDILTAAGLSEGEIDDLVANRTVLGHTCKRVGLTAAGGQTQTRPGCRGALEQSQHAPPQRRQPEVEYQSAADIDARIARRTADGCFRRVHRGHSNTHTKGTK